MLRAVLSHCGYDLDTPFKKLSKKARKMVLHGSEEELDFNLVGSKYQHAFRRKFEGIIPHLQRRYRETKSQDMREWLERYMSRDPCGTCLGARLRKESLSVKIAERNIAEISSLPVMEAKRFFDTLALPGEQKKIARRILRELKERLGFLEDIGVPYLTLDRTAATLSGGESQRIRLANQIGSSLTGVLYILDEPSIGLHPRDNARLIRSLKIMRDKGNTVIVVEHDEDTMRSADFIVDLGAGAGIHGGNVIYAGPPRGILKEKRSLTGQYLSGGKMIVTPESRRTPGGWLTVVDASEHNLKHIDVPIPLGVFTAVTGVSGSGKSTLVNDILYKALAKKLYTSPRVPGKHRKIRGDDRINRVISIDQSPIGRTPRSNPATYIGLFTPLRELFSKIPEAKMRGFKPGRFSFNVRGGRCEACEGAGLKKVEMHFLPDIYITCEVCKGKRYNRETLDVLYKGKHISDVLNMTAEQALDFFSHVPVLKRKLDTLNDVGLGYIQLGQSATTLSGGEAQRIKLSRELSKIATGDTLYILDEPTTGLHFDDVSRLLKILGRLTDKGNTVMVIEHNMDIIRNADHIIDLGPEGGEAGGEVVVSGTPEAVAAFRGSYTGRYLKKALSRTAGRAL
jgi:excinuclease ABC subunit A